MLLCRRACARSAAAAAAVSRPPLLLSFPRRRVSASALASAAAAQAATPAAAGPAASPSASAGPDAADAHLGALASFLAACAVPAQNAQPLSCQSPSSWADTVAAAEALVDKHGSPVRAASDLLGADLSLLTSNIRRLLGSDHPVLHSIASYYFSSTGGKHIRPILVLLIAHATAPIARQSPSRSTLSSQGVDDPISRQATVQFAVRSDKEASEVLAAQRRLAEITEMIHTASLLHDDVIDASLTRRALPTVNATHGNKMAVLAGDFLLARASVALARLRNVEVVELLSTVISDLVEGEFMQLRNSLLRRGSASIPPAGDGDTASASVADAEKFFGNTSLAPLNIPRQFESDSSNARFEYYLSKTFLKTASLIANSCRASAILGGCDEVVADAAYRYGRSLGLAFQVVDDLLDFTVSADEMGKPVNADVKLGIATAPVLYAACEFPELDGAIERNFKQDGDDAL
ncbi:coq1 putative hexaprenyl diphosphate synthase, partial [Entophlyctis sp. JEL0112]